MIFSVSAPAPDDTDQRASPCLGSACRDELADDNAFMACGPWRPSTAGSTLMVCWVMPLKEAISIQCGFGDAQQG